MWSELAGLKIAKIEQYLGMILVCELSTELNRKGALPDDVYVDSLTKMLGLATTMVTGEQPNG